MSETSFTLHRPDPEPSANVEFYIEHGTASPSPAPEQGFTISELCRAWVEEALAQHFG